MDGPTRSDGGAPLGVGDTLTLPQLRTLVVLDRCGPVKPAVLARTLGIDASKALLDHRHREVAALVGTLPSEPVS